MRVGAMLRNPAYGLAPPSPYPGDLYPYIEIVLTDRERINALTRLSAVMCAAHGDHTDASRAVERVAALTEAANIVDFLDAKQRRAR